MNITELKEALYNYCMDTVQERINRIETQIAETQAAANAETKSSVGDKYETGRAMMQQQKNNFLSQLSEANKLKQALDKMPPHLTSESVAPGTLIKTSSVHIYLAISLGPTKFMDRNILIISPVTPLGKTFLQRKTQDEIIFNNTKYVIQDFI